MDTVCGDHNPQRRDWSSLDYVVGDQIFKGLPVCDLLRCRCVCTSWRFVTQTLVKSSPVNSSVLVLPKSYLPRQQITNSDEESCNFFIHREPGSPAHLCCFFNPVACELYPLAKVYPLDGKYLIGLSKGWALFKGLNDNLVVFNAPTGICIRIPGSIVPSCPIKKAIFWGGDTILNPRSHGIVAITDTWTHDLSFSAIWGYKMSNCTLLDLNDPCDVTYFNGLVYAVSKNGFIQSWDPNPIVGTVWGYKPTKVEHFLPNFNAGKELALGCELRLVDSSGELWLVSKPGFWTPSKIGVYKLDFKEKKWVDMDSLGDRVVVLCKNQSIAFSPLSSSKYKRNCVYFEDDDYEELTTTHRSVYVYNLEDGSLSKSILGMFL